MRRGTEYLESLRDRRTVWVLGEGPVADVTTHPTTRDMVQEYVAWYERHGDPAWHDILLTTPADEAEPVPLAFLVPTCAADLCRMEIGRAHV